MGLFGSPSREAARRASEETQRSQAAAADPGASAWVSANAGTGKTHVLTMRVLRLLLGGTPPERISGAHLHQGGRGRDVEARVRRARRVGDGRRGRARRQLAELLDRAPTPTEMLRARAAVRHRHRDARAASRCRPSTPSASGCCSASRWRPACRRASPSSTTSERSALLARSRRRDAGRGDGRKPGAPLARRWKSAVGYAADGNFDQRSWRTRCASMLGSTRPCGSTRRQRRLAGGEVYAGSGTAAPAVGLDGNRPMRSPRCSPIRD